VSWDNTLDLAFLARAHDLGLARYNNNKLKTKISTIELIS